MKTKQFTFFFLKIRISISKEKYIFHKDSNRQGFNSLGGIARISHLDNPKEGYILASKKIQCLQEPKSYVPDVNPYTSLCCVSPTTTTLAIKLFLMTGEESNSHFNYYTSRSALVIVVLVIFDSLCAYKFYSVILSV